MNDLINTTLQQIKDFAGDFANVESVIFRDGNLVRRSASGVETVIPLGDVTETDPTVPGHVKSITTTNISNWNTAFGWGNHASAGYLTSATLQQVTTAGNTTTNAITVGGLVVDTNTLVVDAVNNRVGIGTTNPSTPLDVIGAGRFSGYVRSDFLNTYNNSKSIIGNPSNYTSIYDGIGIEAIRIASNGNVLIGTTTDAGYKLDVNGTVRAVNDITTNGAFVVTSTSLSGSVKYFNIIRSTDNFNPFYITSDKVFMYGVFFQLNGQGGGTIYSTNSVGGASTYITMSGPAYYGSTSGIAGTFAVTGQSFMASGNATFNTLTVAPIINNTGTYSGIFRGFYYNPTLTSLTGTTHRSIETTSGDVILNTQSASVNSGYTTVAVGGSSGVYFQMYVGTNSATQNLRGQIWAVGNNLLFNNPSSGYLGLYTTLYSGITIFPTTGNVHVGTGAVDAGYKLDVSGKIRSTGSGTNGVILHDGTYGVKVWSNGYVFTIEKEGSYGPTTYLFKYSDGTTALNLNSTSIIGLPGDDAVMMSRNVYARHDAAFGFTTYGGTTKYKAIQALHTDNNTSGVAFNYKTGGTDTEAMRINSAGNVLIGTTNNAGYKLDVNGDTRVSGSMTVNNRYLYHQGASAIQYFMTSNAWSGTNSIFFGDDSSSTIGSITYNHQFDSLSFGVNGSNAVFISSSRNVMIGTTTDEGYKLDVNGTTRVSGVTSVITASQRISFNLNQGVFIGLSVNNNAIGANNSNRLFIGSEGDLPIYSLAGGTVIIGDLANPASSASVKLRIDSTTQGFLQPRMTNAQALAITTPATGLQVYDTTNNKNLLYNGTAWQNIAIETWLTSGSNIYYNTGNVGIGTQTPTDKLHIVDNTNGNKFARIAAGGANASAAWVAQNDQVDNIVYRVFGSGVSDFQLGHSLSRSASLLANLNGTGKFLIGTYSSTDLVFGTGDQPRMKLVDSTGNFLIGTMTDNGNKLTVSGTIDSQGYRVNNIAGYTGILNIPGNPPGMQNVDIQGGIIVNIF